MFTAGFCKRLHLGSPTYLRATFAWPPHIHRTIRENHCESTSDIFHSAMLILSCATLSLYGTYKMISRYVWIWFAMIFADSTSNTRRSRKNSSLNLDVNVGRTIFIKWKMLLFAYIIIISTRIFKILTFFLPSYNLFKTSFIIENIKFLWISGMTRIC